MRLEFWVPEGRHEVWSLLENVQRQRTSHMKEFRRYSGDDFVFSNLPSLPIDRTLTELTERRFTAFTMKK